MENSTAKIILEQKLEEMSFAYHVDIVTNWFEFSVHQTYSKK